MPHKLSFLTLITCPFPCKWCSCIAVAALDSTAAFCVHCASLLDPKSSQYFIFGGVSLLFLKEINSFLVEESQLLFTT